MPVLISLLRGINLAGRRKVKMEELRAIYAAQGFQDVQTYINSGNVIFKTGARDLLRLRQRLEDSIEEAFGFRSHVVLRTPADLRDVIARNPFAAKECLDPRRLAICFLAGELSTPTQRLLHTLDCKPEELHAHARELFIYYPNGMARPKLSLVAVEKIMKISGTSRNLNTVKKLLEMAEKLEA